MSDILSISGLYTCYPGCAMIIILFQKELSSWTPTVKERPIPKMNGHERLWTAIYGLSLQTLYITCICYIIYILLIRMYFPIIRLCFLINCMVVPLCISPSPHPCCIQSYWFSDIQHPGVTHICTIYAACTCPLLRNPTLFPHTPKLMWQTAPTQSKPTWPVSNTVGWTARP